MGPGCRCRAVKKYGADFFYLGPQEMLKLARGTTEIRSSQATFLVKTIKYFVLPFCAFVQGKILKVRWRHHADRRAFNWDWKSCNFNRVAAVNLLLSKFDDPIYLEIGCADNALFDSVSCTKKVGVDPASGGTMKMTSDEFFFQNETEFDVIFIDGLHTYEQVRRDVINALKFSHVNSWIALHDMLPRNWVEHHVPCISHGAWTGDVWKVAFELSKTEGIDFKILKIDRGVGIFKVIKKDVVMADFTKELRGQEFSYFYENLNSLPVTEWNTARQWLS